MRRALLAAPAALLLILAACGDDDGGDERVSSSSETSQPEATSEGADEPGLQASARFSLTYEGEEAEFELGQSPIVESTLDGPPTNPVQLHAADEDDPLLEFSLSGVVEAGEDMPTTEALALGLNFEVGPTSGLLSSTAGECLVTVDEIDDDSLAGSFTCDTTYGDAPLTAEGTFAAA